MVPLGDSEGPEQSDLGLRYPHMPKDTFLDGEAHIKHVSKKKTGLNGQDLHI